MDLSKGRVSSTLARKAGPQLQQDCSASAPLEIGQVVETEGYGLRCKILHCNLPPWKDEETTKPVNKLFTNLFLWLII